MSELEASLVWQVKVAKLPAPETQVRFAAPRRWRFDLAWPDKKVAVDVDGGTWSGGRHVRGAGVENDCEKQAAAVLAGWKLLRVTGAQVDDGRALTWIEQALGGDR